MRETEDDDGQGKPTGEPTGEREVGRAEIEAHEEALPHEGEIDFEPDVEFLHRAIYREFYEPEEGREPTPWWLWAISALALFWGGWYLGHHGGTFDTGTHLAYFYRLPYIREQEERAAAATIADPVQAGHELYNAHCQVCHQPTGEGMPGVFPPLIGAERVVGPPAGLVLILLHGLTGPVTVRGEQFNGTMPAWVQLLSDAEIAAIATFIRQWETNQEPPVSPELVAELRAATATRTTPWTNAELDAALATPEIAEAIAKAEEVEQ